MNENVPRFRRFRNAIAVTGVIAGQTYAVCVEEDDDTVNELTIFDSDTGAITLFDPPVWVHGCTVDSRGCILMLEKQESCTRLVVMHYDPTRDFAKARYLLGIRYRPDPPVRCRQCLKHTILLNTSK